MRLPVGLTSGFRSAIVNAETLWRGEVRSLVHDMTAGPGGCHAREAQGLVRFSEADRQEPQAAEDISTQANNLSTSAVDRAGAKRKP